MLFHFHELSIISGQHPQLHRCERAKWVNAFERMNAVAFCVSLNDYRVTVPVGHAAAGKSRGGGGGGGGRGTSLPGIFSPPSAAVFSKRGKENAIKIAVSLFARIVNHEVFSGSTAILFLNKADLFQVL